MFIALALATTLIAADPEVRPVDLLAQIDVKRDAVAGEWSKSDGPRLQVKAGGGCKLQLPSEVPANFSLSFGATPKDDDTAMLAIGLIVSGKPVHVFLDHWQDPHGPDASGPAINGSLPSDQSLPKGTRHQGTLLIPNKENAIVCTVQNGLVTVEVNGKIILNWQNDPKTADMREWWATPNPQLFWIGCHSEKGIEFSRISITTLPDQRRVANAGANVPGGQPQNVVPKAGQPAANAPQQPAQAALPKKKISPSTARLIQFIKQQGGDVELDETLDQPIVKIMLANSKVTDASLSQFKGLSGVAYLDLENTPVTDKGIASLATLVSLETLRVAGTNVTLNGVGQLQKRLPQLQVVWEPSSQSQITIAEAVKQLGGKVETEASLDGGIAIVLIDLSDAGDAVTDAVLAHFRGLTHLRVLRLSSKNVTNVGVSFLAGLRNLRELRLGWAAVNDNGLVHLSQMTKLDDLVLHGTTITDAGLAHFAGLKELRFLSLSETSVTGIGFRRLTELTHLERVDLGQFATDAGFVELAKIKGLQDVYLGGRKNLTDAGIANLQRALPKLTFHN